MLPVLDKPLIQYAVEEARDAGIERFIFVTGKGKTAIENHFDRAFECEHTLKQRGNQEALAKLSIEGIAPGAFVFIRQPVPLGLGHAIWCARHVLDEPFAVILADDLIVSKTPEIGRLMAKHREKGGQWISVQSVPQEDVEKYGIIQGTQDPEHDWHIRHLVEKPSPEHAPSQTAILGRYILDPGCLKRLDDLIKRHTTDQEVQITETLSHMIPEVPLLGLPLAGRRFDCGHLKGMLRATLALARERPDMLSLLNNKEA